MKENNELQPKKQVVRKMEKMMSLILFFLFFFISCGLIEDKDILFSPSTLIENEEEQGEEQREEQGREYNFASYEYWSELISREKDNIDFLIKWILKNDYIEAIQVIDNEIDFSPSNKNVRIRLQSDENIDRIKEILIKNELTIHNDWSISKNICLFHGFGNGDERIGVYVLTYTEDIIRDDMGDEILKVNEPYYKKVSENLYSSVDFYE